MSDLMDDRNYIQELRERIHDLQRELMAMQMRAIEAEKALEGARRSEEFYKADATEAYARASQAEQQNAAMRALLERVAKEEVTGTGGDAGDLHYCAFCQLESLDFQPLEHVPECPWLQARAFLAEHPQS